MLLRLSVENFILIHKLDLDFQNGFTCITGETGAGKSILVGALGLLLGQRADYQVLREKERKCIVEGVFQLDGYGLEPVFKSSDLDYESTSIFRREIGPTGKSRAFINDTPVNLTLLKEIGDRLVDIHSQNQTIELNGAAFQLEMVDSYSQVTTERNLYAESHTRYLQMKRELQDSEEMERKLMADKEYIEFQLEELNKANLYPGEQNEAEAELELLTHAEEIKSKLYAAIRLLDEAENNVLSGISEARQAIENAARFSPQIEPLAERIGSSYIEMKEITRELQTLSAHIHFDPERIHTLTQRLDLIYHLEQKHRLASVEELMTLRDHLIEKLDEMVSAGDRILRLKTEIKEIELGLSEKARFLEQKRKLTIPRIQKEVELVLAELGMPSAKFLIQMEHLDSFTPYGINRINFLFSANRGGEVREIQKVASGGELSRLMLAIKSMIVKKSMLPTILFDEIDSGVSGEVAGKMGSIMRKIAETLQVIAITHLPQIAAKAHQHILAIKEDTSDGTISSLALMDEDQRINEIARMLSDDKITVTTKAAARELMRID